MCINNNIGYNYRIIVFGTGKALLNNVKSFFGLDIIAYIDNDPSKHGSQLFGKPLLSVDEGLQLNYDYIIISSSKYYSEMREQLIANGVEKKKIISIFETDNLHRNNRKSSAFNMLLVSYDLSYTGAQIVLYYMACLLRDKGLNVVVASSKTGTLSVEYEKKGIPVIVDSELQFLTIASLGWVKSFDVVLVNTVRLAHLFEEVISGKKYYWWIHEPERLYVDELGRSIENRLDNALLDDIKVMAVSSVAASCFKGMASKSYVEVVPYGLPDFYKGERHKVSSKLVFAIIGGIAKEKGYDVFIDAVEKINALGYEERVEFWSIGETLDSAFSRAVQEQMIRTPNAHVKGILDREEMRKAYSMIDVVICSSSAESLSTVVAEGMMNHIPSIIVDGTGMSDYINDGDNGFIIPPLDSDALVKKIVWIISNEDKLPVIGKRARKTYEVNFTMEAFGDRLEKVLNGLYE